MSVPKLGFDIINEEGLTLGYGYNSLTNQPKFSSAILPTLDNPIPEMRTNLEEYSQFTSDRDELLREIKLRAGNSSEIIANLSASREQISNRKKLFLLVNFKKVLSRQHCLHPTIDPKAVKLYQGEGGVDKFFEVYGDKYVSSIENIVAFTALITFDFNDSTDVVAVEGKLKRKDLDMALDFDNSTELSNATLNYKIVISLAGINTTLKTPNKKEDIGKWIQSIKKLCSESKSTIAFPVKNDCYSSAFGITEFRTQVFNRIHSASTYLKSIIVMKERAEFFINHPNRIIKNNAVGKKATLENLEARLRILSVSGIEPYIKEIKQELKGIQDELNSCLEIIQQPLKFPLSVFKSYSPELTLSRGLWNLANVAKAWVQRNLFPVDSQIVKNPIGDMGPNKRQMMLNDPEMLSIAKNSKICSFLNLSVALQIESNVRVSIEPKISFCRENDLFPSVDMSTLSEDEKRQGLIILSNLNLAGAHAVVRRDYNLCIIDEPIFSKYASERPAANPQIERKSSAEERTCGADTKSWEEPNQITRAALNHQAQNAGHTLSLSFSLNSNVEKKRRMENECLSNRLMINPSCDESSTELLEKKNNINLKNCVALENLPEPIILQGPIARESVAGAAIPQNFSSQTEVQTHKQIVGH